MTGNNLRNQYLQFFEDKDSLIVPSSSLVPTDPTTLLTSAGMQPLVPYFKGEEMPPAARLASCQKCCRTDDFDQVGVTWRHASFFEMLGNFSFGDYFKREAIIWGWEFLTKVLSIDPRLLWVSVYHEDDEAYNFWKKDIGLTDDRIFRFDKKDNWWGPVGNSGPCGPDSEIFYDRGPQYDTGDPELDRPGGDGDRYGELWNLVFQQFNQQENGDLIPLPAPGIDTGMGLERTAAVLQGVDTIHHCDLFAPLINAIGQCDKNEISYDTKTPLLDPADPATTPTRVIADHVRAAAFLAGDGITPGNTGRDYMLRRLIRRAFLQGRQLGYAKPFLHRLVPTIVQLYGETYHELPERQEIITDLIRREEERFESTIEGGMTRLEDLLEDLQKKDQKVLSGAEAFHLYETFGFPIELTRELAAEKSVEINQEEYQQAADKHSKISGSGVGNYEKREFGQLESTFVGYEELSCDATVEAIRANDDGTLQVVLDRTPFYAQSGGQVGDTGDLTADGLRAQVLEVQKQGKTWVHTVKVTEGKLSEGQTVHAAVDAARRQAIARAHSATHLLQASLRKHLGNHVEQRGSLVEADRLRFDFVHFDPIDEVQLRLVEETVNSEVLQSLPVDIVEKSLAEAKSEGVMALFGEKYGDVVRTVRMGDFSYELCGGTHLQNTSQAGLLRIVSEGGVGANIRRVEALTGMAAWEYDQEQAQQLRGATHALGGTTNNLAVTAEKMRHRVRELEKQIHQLQHQMAGDTADQLLSEAVEVRGVKVLSARAPQGFDATSLRELSDRLAQKLDGVVALAGEVNGKVLWAVKVSPAALKVGAHAGNIVRELAKITGGGGGGRPDFAQAGGRDVSKIDAALASVPSLLESSLKD
jgi:alanyl-tRNA synthetase